MYFDKHIINQNIAVLHERGGSKKVLHLQGEIFKMRSEKNEALVYDIRDDIRLGDTAGDGAQLRPHIVWFEEPVPKIEEAIPIVNDADILVVVGTSLVVYPAAGLITYSRSQIPKYIIDKNIPYSSSLYGLTAIQKPATEGVKDLIQMLDKL